MDFGDKDELESVYSPVGHFNFFFQSKIRSLQGSNLNEFQHQFFELFLTSFNGLSTSVQTDLVQV